MLVGAAEHRVRLARARLPIGQQAHVEAVQRALHKRPHLRVCVCVCTYTKRANVAEIIRRSALRTRART